MIEKGISTMQTWLSALLSLALLTVSSWLIADTQRTELDAIVVLDSSGSMKKTDPKQLRKPAAKLFISLLGEDDRVSVMSFSDNAYPITYLTQLSTASNKQKTLNATEKVSHKGVYTNIHAALARSIRILDESADPEHDKMIVLLSDGQMDVGNSAQSQALKNKIVDDLIPQLQDKNIRVYSIAFTDASDQQLLQTIAEESDGRYALATTDKELHKVFTQIFEQSKQPDMLPLAENKFTVDPSIREVTIVANKANESSLIRLRSPNGENYSAQQHPQNILWFKSSSFDMITLKKPEAGEWRILFSDNDNSAYIVTDLQLKSDYSNTDNNYTFNSQLLKDGVPTRESNLLEGIHFTYEIDLPDGTLETIDLDTNADNTQTGTISTTFTAKQAGIYNVTITAIAPTFERQNYFSFRIKEWVQASPEEPKEVAPKVVKLEPAKALAEPEETVKEEAPVDDNVMTIILFFAGNTFFIVIGLSVFFWLRMKKKKALKAAEESES